MADESWRWWPAGHEAVRVLARSGSGAAETAQIVVPSRATVQRVAARDLAEIGSRPWASEELVWRAAACRAVLALAPPGSAAIHNPSLEPLPHQVVALERALATNPVRLLFADEVGLGKTIEAGMVITELKARGRARRVLVVAPKGVQLQWVSELALHFGEQFVLVGPGGVPSMPGSTRGRRSTRWSARSTRSSRCPRGRVGNRSASVSTTGNGWMRLWPRDGT